MNVNSIFSCSSHLLFIFLNFQMQDFETIVDILAPCTNVHRFNTYIIAVAFRTLMRWYVLIPENYRLRMAEYIINRVYFLFSSSFFLVRIELELLVIRFYSAPFTMVFIRLGKVRYIIIYSHILIT